MSKNEILSKASGLCHKVGFGLKKRSPEIFVAVGVAGMITSTVLACKATTKVEAILEEHRENLDTVHKCLESDGTKFIMQDGEKVETEYTPEDSRKDTTVFYAKTCMKLFRLYAPAAFILVLSATCIFASHNILRKRSAALAAAYAAVDASFKEYRKAVVERFGEDIDKELRYKIKSKMIAETAEDGTAGEKEIKVSEMGEYSGYARFFDEFNPNYEKDSEYNLMFLTARQNYANDLLRVRGYLFLNDVYDMLGIPRSKAGQIVGWKYDEDNPTGDNYVDFGIFDVTKEKARDFVNGYERAILLDFNVDGPILDHLC